MSTNTITSFSGLWKPTEYRNIEAGKVSIGTIQAGWLRARWNEDELASLHNLWGSLPTQPPNKYADNPHAGAFRQKLFFNTRSGANGELSGATCHLPDYYGRPTETQKVLVDEFYYLDPYSGGGSRTIHACNVSCNAGGSIESLQHSTQNPNGVIGTRASVHYTSICYAC